MKVRLNIAKQFFFTTNYGYSIAFKSELVFVGNAKQNTGKSVEFSQENLLSYFEYLLSFRIWEKKIKANNEVSSKQPLSMSFNTCLDSGQFCFRN